MDSKKKKKRYCFCLEKLSQRVPVTVVAEFVLAQIAVVILL